MFVRIMGIVLRGGFWLTAGTLALFLIGLAAALAGAVLGVLAGYFIPFAALLMLLIVARVAQRLKRHHAQMVMQYVEQILRLNLPLSLMLSAAEASETGGTARRLRWLRWAIEDGESIGEGIASTLPEIEPRHTSAWLAAERLGRLPALVTSWTRRQRRAVAQQDPDITYSWSYAIVLVIFTALLAGGMSVFLAPQYEEIFDDFVVTLPAVTRVTFDAMPLIAPLMLPLAILAAMAAAGYALRIMLHSPDRRPMPGGAIIGTLLWHLPVVHGVQRDRGMAEACELVAEAVAAGHPLHQALAQAGELRINPVLGRRLAAMARQLEAGASLADAAAGRLPGVAAQVLATAEASAEPANVFRFLHRYFRYRVSRLAELARATVLPAIVMVMALVVGWLCVAFFYPLVVLMSADGLHAESWL